MKPSATSLTFCSLTVGLIGLLFLVVDSPQPLLPPLISLALIALTGSAGWSLFLGSLSAVLLIGGSSPILAPWRLVTEHLGPALTSPWHWSALVFTILLAAFAAIIERSGALASLLYKWTAKDASLAGKRFQTSIVSLGLICFFDGLASALMLGRVGSGLADRTGVSREKLAYLVDTTSSAVACVAFLSTWSVFQLMLISNELAQSPFSEPAYLLFLKSIPSNFYCLSSLLLVFLAARWNWNPPPMAKASPRKLAVQNKDNQQEVKPLAALAPVLILVLSVPFAFWIVGGQKFFPTSTHDIQSAFATDRGPYALLLAGLITLAGAITFFPGKRKKAFTSIPRAIGNLLPALVVLLMAWTLGSTLSALRTGEFLANLLGDDFTLSYLPGATFILGCLVAFCTGTSWGTMALLMPLSLATFLSLASEQNLAPTEIAPLLPPLIAAVFGGAVFGDHASPFSDTTIISALACGVSTTSHVVTQLPYAALAAGCALLFGYLPLGIGLTPWLVALLPLIAVFLIVMLTRKRFAT